MQTDWQAADALAMAVLAANDGVAKMRSFLDAGLTNRQVAAIHERGVIARPRNAWYAHPALSWQAMCAIRVGGVLGCISAIDSFGLPTPPWKGRDIHVAVPTNSARLRHHRDKRHYVVPGEDVEVTVHWATEGRTYVGWRTPLVESLLALTDCVPLEWWIAALDAAVHRPRTGGEPLLSAEQYEDFVARLPRRLRRHLPLIDPRAESPLETLLRLGMLFRGIDGVAPQFSPDGVREVDFLVGRRLIVEADGQAYHDPEKDAIRDADFQRLGYLVLRFSYDRIVDDLDAVLDEIEAALAALD
jgi:very-short-patch-repair endonuclease